MIKKPNIKEYCQDEIRDFILELVQKEQSNINETFCRRKELCEAILAVNKPTGKREMIKRSALNIIKVWDCKANQIRKLADLGFNVIKGKSHYKVYWDDSAYCTIVGATPSDHRANFRRVADLNRTFF